METAAIPQTLHLTPIQLTAVPVKLNIAVDAMTLEATMPPPLKVPVSAPYVVQKPIAVAAPSSELVAVGPVSVGAGGGGGGGGGVVRAVPAGNVGMAGRAQGDRVAGVIATSPEVGGVDQGGAGSVKLGNERVVAARERRLKGPRRGREIGARAARHVGVSIGI